MARTPEDTQTDPDSMLRFGAVASVDLAGARCTVTLDDSGDEAVESPALRWIEPRMGKTRSWSPPSVGEQVMLICPGGEIGAGIVMRGGPCDAFAAPSTEEIDLIRFDDDGEISYSAAAHELKITLPSGAKITVVADGGIDITGDITLTGKLTASDDVIASGKSLKGHKHGGVQAGGSQTGVPA